MTDLAMSVVARRTAAPRRFLMCPPDFFAVTYAINPWMHVGVAVDPALARRQWDALRETYLRLGHTVEVLDACPGLPDMVFAANAGTVVDGTVIPARFRFPERRGEEAPYAAWFASHGFTVVADPDAPINEGEGDFLLAGDLLLSGTGFRSDTAAAVRAAEVFGREIVPLHLVDPRYYHLDTALAVLDERTVAYLPEAFSLASQATLAALFPDAILATPADAEVLGLNIVSDGANVVVPAGTATLAVVLAARGFTVHEVDMSELRKAGGAAKCCTLELRDAR